LNTELGKLLQKNAGLLRRELPFALAQDSPSTSLLDRVMLRGRIDLMLPYKDGLAVVDYKTDNVTPAQISARADSYRQQVETYRTALERLAKAKVTAVYLVFLEAKTIWEVETLAPSVV